MVNNKTFWNWSVTYFVYQSMNLDGEPIVSYVPVFMSSSCICSHPIDAVVVWEDVGVCENLFKTAIKRSKPRVVS